MTTRSPIKTIKNNESKSTERAIAAETTRTYKRKRLKHYMDDIIIMACHVQNVHMHGF